MLPQTGQFPVSRQTGNWERLPTRTPNPKKADFVGISCPWATSVRDPLSLRTSQSRCRAASRWAADQEIRDENETCKSLDSVTKSHSKNVSLGLRWGWKALDPENPQNANSIGMIKVEGVVTRAAVFEWLPFHCAHPTSCHLPNASVFGTTSSSCQNIPLRHGAFPFCRPIARSMRSNWAVWSASSLSSKWV
jgi:hypothetical protein